MPTFTILAMHLRVKRILALLCLLLPLAALAQANLEITDAYFVDEFNGWITGTADHTAVFLHTSDGGKSWSRIAVPAKNGFCCLHFQDRSIGVALEMVSETKFAIYRTADGGKTWTQVSVIKPGNGVHLWTAYSAAPDSTFVAGEGSGGVGYVAQITGMPGTVRVRDDLPVDFSEQSNTLDIFGDGAGHLWIAGKELILHSADNGITWENQAANAHTGIDLVSGFALPGGYAWITGAHFEIYRTVDYGVHWLLALDTTEGEGINFDSISFIDKQRGCALGDSPKIYCTSDGGKTWSSNNVFPNYVADSTYARLFLFPSSHGWAVMNGALYKTVDGAKSFQEVLTKTAPVEADLPGEFQARTVRINGPTNLAWSSDGYLYILQAIGPKIFRLNLEHASMKTILTTPEDEDSSPDAIAVDPHGDIVFADSHGRLLRLDHVTSQVTEIMPEPPQKDDALNITAMTFDRQGNLLLLDRLHRIFLFGPQGLKKIAGSGMGGFSGDGGPASEAELNFPDGVAMNARGDIFIADYQNCRIRKIDAKSKVIRTIAGTGECVSGGDGGPAIKAALNYPGSIVTDSKGNLFFLEGAIGRVRRIDRKGTITTYAGTGEKGFSGDGGPADQASLNDPAGLALDSFDNLYIADYVSNRIRKVDALTHIIMTVAGNGKPIRLDIQM